MTTQFIEALEVLKNGGVITHLTDTIWGLACDPTQDAAVERIHNIKQRPSGKSFIVLISDPNQLYNYVEKIPEIAWDIIEFAEEPLTVVYPKGKGVSAKVLADDGSIAIRLVKKGGCFELLKKLKNGLVSTSANLSGSPSPLKFKDIDPNVLDKLDFVLPSNDSTNHKPSKIIKLEIDGGFKVIRN